MISINSGTIAGSCGVGMVFDYRICKDSDYWNISLEKYQTEGGCGWVFAAFIEGDETCEQAYEIMKNKWKIMYQSPIKLNINSGNNFFFCIFEVPEEEPRGFNYETEAEYLERGGREEDREEDSGYPDNEEEPW